MLDRICMDHSHWLHFWQVLIKVLYVIRLAFTCFTSITLRIAKACCQSIDFSKPFRTALKVTVSTVSESNSCKLLSHCIASAQVEVKELQAIVSRETSRNLMSATCSKAVSHCAVFAHALSTALNETTSGWVSWSFSIEWSSNNACWTSWAASQALKQALKLTVLGVAVVPWLFFMQETRNWIADCHWHDRSKVVSKLFNKTVSAAKRFKWNFPKSWKLQGHDLLGMEEMTVLSKIGVVGSLTFRRENAHGNEPSAPKVCESKVKSAIIIQDKKRKSLAQGSCLETARRSTLLEIKDGWMDCNRVSQNKPMPLCQPRLLHACRAVPQQTASTSNWVDRKWSKISKASQTLENAMDLYKECFNPSISLSNNILQPLSTLPDPSDWSVHAPAFAQKNPWKSTKTVICTRWICFSRNWSIFSPNPCAINPNTYDTLQKPYLAANYLCKALTKLSWCLACIILVALFADNVFPPHGAKHMVPT